MSLFSVWPYGPDRTMNVYVMMALERVGDLGFACLYREKQLVNIYMYIYINSCTLYI